MTEEEMKDQVHNLLEKAISMLNELFNEFLEGNDEKRQIAFHSRDNLALFIAEAISSGIKDIDFLDEHEEQLLGRISSIFDERRSELKKIN